MGEAHVHKAGKSKKARKPPLTPREAKLHKLLIKNEETKGKPRTYGQLLVEAGYSQTTAEKCTSIVIGNVRKKTGMVSALEKAGINSDKIAEKIAEGFDANKVISAVIMPGAKGKGGEDMKDAGSTTLDTVDVPDHTNRRGYIDMAAKMIPGTYAPKEVEHSGEVGVHNDDVSELIGWLKESKGG